MFAVPMRCMPDWRMGRVDATCADAAWTLATLARYCSRPAVTFAMLRLRLARFLMGFASPIPPSGFGRQGKRRIASPISGRYRLPGQALDIAQVVPLLGIAE